MESDLVKKTLTAATNSVPKKGNRRGKSRGKIAGGFQSLGEGYRGVDSGRSDARGRHLFGEFGG